MVWIAAFFAQAFNTASLKIECEITSALFVNNYHDLFGLKEIGMFENMAVICKMTAKSRCLNWKE